MQEDQEIRKMTQMKKQDKHVSVWLSLITGYCTIWVQENNELQ